MHATKKMRSTHACTPSFATFFLAIFTSVVVYSRTSTKHKKNKTKQSGVIIAFNSPLCRHIINYSLTLLIKRQQKKMRSTHACTLSFAHFFFNIHVSCCLFSHDSIANLIYEQMRYCYRVSGLLLYEVK